ncbi:MAG: hypothetical protein WC700_04895 [Gemmatimonadaceae bacterium]
MRRTGKADREKLLERRAGGAPPAAAAAQAGRSADRSAGLRG